jgi:hypothetical protein
MILKDILALFFRYPVKGLPVIDQTGGGLAGIVKKDRIIELSSNKENLDLDIGKVMDRIMTGLDEASVSETFGSVAEDFAIPVLDRSGETGKFETRKNILGFLQEKRKKAEAEASIERSRRLVVQGQSAGTGPSAQNPAVPAQEEARVPAGVPSFPERLGILDSILVPVLVTSPGKVIVFANQYFLSTFNLERDFVLRQKITLFFPKIRIDNSLAGAFTYQHRRWQYRVNYDLDHIFVSFNEMKTGISPFGAAEVEKIMKSKADLKSLLETYETGLIRKVHQKTKLNTQQTARLLGLKEEDLKYRLQKMR